MRLAFTTLRHQLPYRCGRIILTFGRSLASAPLAKTRDQKGQLQQIRDAQEGTPLPHKKLKIRSDRVRPLRRNRANGAVVDPQQQPLSRAVIPLPETNQPTAAERVERMRYPHKLHRSSGKACIRRRVTSGWSAAASSGRRRPTGQWRSARRNWPICSTGSIGETRGTPGGRSWPAECRHNHCGVTF